MVITCSACGPTGALEALWPLAEGTFVSQLIARLPAGRLPDLALLYHRLLSALPALAPATAGQGSKEEQRFVNALVRCLTAALACRSHLSSSDHQPCSRYVHRGQDCGQAPVRDIMTALVRMHPIRLQPSL